MNHLWGCPTSALSPYWSMSPSYSTEQYPLYTLINEPPMRIPSLSSFSILVSVSFLFSWTISSLQTNQWTTYEEALPQLFLNIGQCLLPIQMNNTGILSPHQSMNHLWGCPPSALAPYWSVSPSYRIQLNNILSTHHSMNHLWGCPPSAPAPYWSVTPSSSSAEQCPLSSSVCSPSLPASYQGPPGCGTPTFSSDLSERNSIFLTTGPFL